MIVAALSFWWLPVAIFAYLAVGAAVIGFLDRYDPAYSYEETWWIWMFLWPLAIVGMIGAGVCVALSAPFRWIYHRVRLRGRDKELRR